MAIDGSKIIQAITERSKIRESKGIIPLFGVYLSIFPVDYYNAINFNFEKRMEPEKMEESRRLLISAGQECGYATFQGIRNSYEWEQIVIPMIEKPEDQIHGFIAVAIAFGWGDLEVVEIDPGKRLIVRARDSYEASGYIKNHGIGDSGKCYMLRGVTAAFMDLIYGEDYPDGCFNYTTREPLCRAKGDSCCEFIAEKSSA